MALLELKNVALNYGAVRALKDVSLEVNEGEVVSLLGCNGAGKTSTLHAISRTVDIASGDILFNGQSLRKIKPHHIVRLGIAHSPEGRRIFPEMDVMENLEMGAYTVREKNALQTNLDRAFHFFPRLAERRNQLGGTLSGGEQQMLAVARALMSSPKLLMLDEPSLGLAPLIVERIFEIITQINKEENVTIFLVEQNANEALLHSDRAYILETGATTMSGDAKDLRNDPKIQEAYLGG